MASPGQMTPAQVLQDPKFQGLPVEERRKVLLKVDPNFGGLAHDQQDKVLGWKSKTQPEEPGWWQGFGQMGGGIAKAVGRTALNLGEIASAPLDALQRFVGGPEVAKQQEQFSLQAHRFLEPSNEKEKIGGVIGEGFQYLVSIGTGTVLEKLGLTATENAPLILKLLSGASKAAIDVGIKTFAMTKDTNKSLEAAGIAAPFGGAYALKGTAAAKALGSLPGFVVRKIPVIGKPIGTMIDVAKALKSIAMPGAKQAELEAGLYEETYGKLPEAASEKANAKALWQETIRKERLNLRNAKPPVKPVPPRETPREAPGWVKAGVEPEAAKTPLEMEPIKTEFPSGRKPGPAPPRPKPPERKIPLWSGVEPEAAKTPPEVESIESELPSGRKPGPAGPRPKPPERKPLWAGVKPAATEEEEAAKTKPSLQKRIEAAREEVKTRAEARKKPLEARESSRSEPADVEPAKPAMREGLYKDAGNPGIASRDLDPGKIINMKSQAKNSAMAGRFKSLGMTPEQVSKMTESEYEQHRIAVNLARKAKGLSQFERVRPGPDRRTWAEFRAEIVREMKKGVERPD